MEYINKNGRDVTLNEYADAKRRINYRQFNTEAEKQLLETLNQVLSTLGNYEPKTQVKVDSILSKYSSDNFDYFSKSTFDFVIFKKEGKDDVPVLAVELDGEEHETRQKSIINDAKKEQICRDNNIKLIRFKNREVRRYKLIKDRFLNLGIFK